MTESDLELRIMKELAEIKSEVQGVKSALDNSRNQVKLEIIDHKNQCWQSGEFVKKSELERDLEGYIQRKQKNFLTSVEVIKALAYLTALLATIYYIKA